MLKVSIHLRSTALADLSPKIAADEALLRDKPNMPAEERAKIQKHIDDNNKKIEADLKSSITADKAELATIAKELGLVPQ